MKFQISQILLGVLFLPVGAGCNLKLEVEAKPTLTINMATVRPIKKDATIQPPVTYAGLIPCADCPGIDYTLNLLSDGVAVHRFTYLEAENGKNLSFVELMSWRLTKGGQQILLEGNSENIQRFGVKKARTLRLLNRQGNPIKSGLNYDLMRAEKFAPIKGSLNLRGYYSRVKNAAMFKECQTGKRFPVLQKADSISLKRAYLNAVEKPGESLFVALKGQLAMRLSVESKGREDLFIVPEHFGQVQAHGRCP
jgi:copper homeostasis protein (lipoprotein)